MSIPFETFATFTRVLDASPLFACEKPEWAAAAHAIVVNDTVHYIWSRRRVGNSWVLLHSTAPASDPAAVTHDPRNPVLLPAEYEAFDDHTVEYPFPFLNPADQRYYMYYLGKREKPPKQTGLLVSEDGDLGNWTRVSTTPVIAVETDFEERGSSHPSVAIDGDTIHIIYTGESRGPDVLCHATAPTSDPARVTKDSANPVFTGSGEVWDSQGVRETEIVRGPEYFHIFYGGTDGTTWRIGHVRTKDFRTFEPNPANPVFTPSEDPDAWDCDGLLTSQVFNVNGSWYMLYAGLKGRNWQEGLIWQSGLAIAQGD
ncbi:MAG: hypothetical protein HN742_09475 [Lentisphaerae bacterium]|jgi:predicted GH43/DUF377 family glycosyl hydrolase|nr:hypothetical protein [Lentisphaerota bacterium]MBT5606720.1 hypothetical protein [Lentisphaerota bacterium]MBT7056977.1 hypothetical protein [Lentisphaerota bacterium]MBT7842092.1 hypothetical protein [Lentisphaerota bacterium]